MIDYTLGHSKAAFPGGTIIDERSDKSIEQLASMLHRGRSTLLAVDEYERITGIIPDDRKFLGREPSTLIGQSLASTVTGASYEKAELDRFRQTEGVNRKLKQRIKRLEREMSTMESRNRQMMADLNLAVELQKSLLPKSYPNQDLVSFTHRYIPMAMVGGDFFDIIALPGNRTGVMISDVSGHGVAPAFITAMIKSTFDYLAVREEGPAEVITKLNAEFSKIIETEHYVTACYAVFDFTSMTCSFCNAGHPPQLLAHPDGKFTEMEANNPIVGMLDDYTFEESTIPFAGGDILVFYTDGIIESHTDDDSMFGLEGLERSIASTLSDSLDSMADSIITDLIAQLKYSAFEDDITLLLGQAIESL